MTLGHVGVRRLKVHTIVGLLPHERIHKQDIFVSVDMAIDFSGCHQAGVETLSESVDYAAVATELTHWIQQGKFELLETIALLGTERLLEQYPVIQSCTIEIEKPAAIEEATGAWVSWTRIRMQ